MPTITEQKYASDLVLHEYAQVFTREELTLDNDTGGERDFLVGTPLNASGQVITSGDEANAVAILAEKVTALADSGTKKVGVIKNGPVVINSSNLVIESGANSASIQTALKARDFKFVSDPTKSTTQSS